MDNSKQSSLEWFILWAGIWIALSPIIFGAAGTIIFLANVVAGAILIIVALHRLTSNSKKI